MLVVEHAELSKVTDLHVELTCRADRVVIAVEDGLTNKRVERTVDARAVGTPGRDREIALATSSLIVASYLELYVPREHVHPPPPSPSPEGEAAKRVVAETLDAHPRAALQVSTGIRWRNLPEALGVLHVGLRAGGYVRRHWEVSGLAAAEYGRADRVLGQVVALTASFGGGVAWHLRPHEPAGFEVSGALSGGYTRLAGRAALSDVTSGVVEGITAEVELGLGPEFRAGSFIVGLDARSGYTVPNPRGVVTGEADVTLGGFWVGLGLRLGGAFGVRPFRGRTRPAARQGPQG
jgi:hypothetical protein